MAENAIEIQEKPILFSGAMVRAVIEGRKTQTRRVAKLACELADKHKNVRMESGDGLFLLTREAMHSPRLRENFCFACPYGNPGDRLWVRETHYRWGKWVKSGFTAKGRQRWRFSVKAIGGLQSEVRYIDQTFPEWSSAKKRTELGWHKRPAIFMPRWASRLTLEIISVKVERVQEISEEDAIAEGCHAETVRCSHGKFQYDEDAPFHSNAREDFACLWGSINAKRGFGWEKNPWVWAVEFKVLAAGERRA